MGVYPNYRLAFMGTGRSDNLPDYCGIRETPAWFHTIPPERVGLDGKYDHCGLQKRVEAAFAHCFNGTTLSRLFVSQRGRVVILQGHAVDREMLRRLVEVAKQVEGTTRVESTGVIIDTESIAMVGADC